MAYTEEREERPRRDVVTGRFSPRSMPAGGLTALVVGPQDTGGDLLWTVLQSMAPMSATIIEQLLHDGEKR